MRGTEKKKKRIQISKHYIFEHQHIYIMKRAESMQTEREESLDMGFEKRNYIRIKK